MSIRSKTWVHRFAWLTAGATLILIWSGGMVTSKGAGLAVPDWPNSFGYNMFLFPISQWVGAIFYEHTHRLIASTVGFLTMILAVWLWRVEHRRWVRNLGWLALLAVTLQGVLGGLRVTMLKDEIGIFHACLAQAFLGLLVYIAVATSDFWQSLPHIVADSKHFIPLRTIALVATVAIYLQLALGATMRHQHRDLALLDFPTANGDWLPDTSLDALQKINAWRDARGLSNVTAFQIWLQMAHRFGAVIVAAGVITFFARVRRVARTQLLGATAAAIDPIARGLAALKRLSLWWLLLLLVQITLGAWTIWSNKAADVATTHVAVGAIMLSFGVIVCAICGRVSQVSCNADSLSALFEERGASIA